MSFFALENVFVLLLILLRLSSWWLWIGERESTLPAADHESGGLVARLESARSTWEQKLQPNLPSFSFFRPTALTQPSVIAEPRPIMALLLLGGITATAAAGRESVAAATCRFQTTPKTESLPGGFKSFVWRDEPYSSSLFQDGFIEGGKSYEEYMSWLTTTIPRDFHGLNPLDQRACLEHRTFRPACNQCPPLPLIDQRTIRISHGRAQSGRSSRTQGFPPTTGMSS